MVFHLSNEFLDKFLKQTKNINHIPPQFSHFFCNGLLNWCGLPDPLIATTHLMVMLFFFQEYFYLSFSSSDVSNSGTPLHKGDKVEFYVATDKRYNVYCNL